MTTGLLNGSAAAKAYREPITYSVPTTTPVRIAGTTDPPLRIINPAVTGTVWLSTNSGMAVGQGTPLHPGTSISWTREVEIWAIAEQANASVIVTNHIDDWQPDPASIAAAILAAGIPIITQTQLLFDDIVGGANPDQFPLTFNAPFADVRHISVRLEGVANPTQPDVITITTSKNGVAKVLSLIIPPSAIWDGIAIPTPDQPDTITVDGTNLGNTYNVTISASSADVDRLIQGNSSFVTGYGSYIYNQDVGTVLAAGVISRTTPPFFGDVELKVRGIKPAGASPYVVCDEYTDALVFVSTFTDSMIATGVTRWSLHKRFVMGGSPLRISIVNQDAANNMTNVNLFLTPATGGIV